jgi:hypothetical protein
MCRTFFNVPKVFLRLFEYQGTSLRDVLRGQARAIIKSSGGAALGSVKPINAKATCRRKA